MLRVPLSALDVSNLENPIILILTIHRQNIYTPLFFLYIFWKVEYTVSIYTRNVYFPKMRNKKSSIGGKDCANANDCS